MNFDERWQAHHSGVAVDRNIWVKGWLKAIVTPAKVLAKLKVAPSFLTFVGLIFAGLTIWVSSFGLSRSGLVVCAFLVFASSYFDGLDGAVAILRDRVSTFGSKLDRAADRLTEIAWVIMLALFGCPDWLAIAALLVTWGYEFLRWRRSKKALLPVTVGERPVRVVLTVMFLIAAAVLFGWATWWVSAAAVGWVLVALLGAAQVLKRR
jgi:CDP-diacylglycerol--glycerol-3-phosphate 3-phosphatidyltransferase